MDDPPGSGEPENFVAYPRGGGTKGDAAILRSLAEGYFNLNSVSLLNLLLGMVVIGASFGTFQHGGPQLLVGTILLAIVMGLLIYPCVRKIGHGLEWNESTIRIYSILLALNSLFCCGIFGYLVIQHIALREIKRYGIGGSVLGLKRKEVARKVAELEGTTAESFLGFPQR